MSSDTVTSYTVHLRAYPEATVTLCGHNIYGHGLYSRVSTSVRVATCDECLRAYEEREAGKCNW